MSERAGWITAYHMIYVMFEHGVTYARVGCTGDVWTTCNGGNNHDERM